MFSLVIDHFHIPTCFDALSVTVLESAGLDVVSKAARIAAEVGVPLGSVAVREGLVRPACA